MFIIHRKLFLALKKVQIVKITHPQVRITPLKNSPPVKFQIPPHPLLLFRKLCPNFLKFWKTSPHQSRCPTWGSPLPKNEVTPTEKQTPLH